MDYEEFVQKYKVSKDKEAFAKKHIKRQYVPYVEKLSEAKKIANISTHVTIDKKIVYSKNTPILYFLKTTRLLALYTDVEIKETDNINNAYDALAEIGAFDTLLSQIPEGEITQFTAMIDMCVADIYENERDIASFLDTKFEALGMILNTMLESFKQTLGDVNVEQLVKDNISKFPTPESNDNTSTENN